MTNEIKEFLKHAPFNKAKWTKHIAGLNKVPKEHSDIINVQKYLYCLAAFINLTPAEKQKFLRDPKNKPLIETINSFAKGMSLESAHLVSELVLDQFRVENAPKLRSRL